MLVLFYRTVIIFFVIVAALRLMGKRQLGELELSELVVAVLVSDLAAMPLQDTSMPLLHGIIPVVTLLLCELLISGVALKSIKFRSFMAGRPSVVIENGKINQAEMTKNRLSLDELSEALRKKDIMNVADVRYAVLETDGSLSALLYSSKLPVTPEQCGLSVTDEGIPLPVICDGRVLSDNLKKLKLDEKWLNEQLKAQGAASAEEVYFMTSDGEQCSYIAIKNKKSKKS